MNELPAQPRVLITGAGRGIGRALALRFAAEGAQVALAARSVHELEAVAEAIRAAGGTALAVPMDVTDLASVENGMHQVLEFTGGVLDVVINNAGVFSIHPFAEMSPATWYRMLAVNLNGPFHVSLLALKGLEQSRRGHLFNISSVAGQMPFEGSSAYCTTKYGLRGFTDVLREEFRPHHIRVSCVYPGATDTTIFDALPGDWDRSQMNTVEEVAEVVWQAYASPLDADVDELTIPNPRLEQAQA